MKQLPRYQKVIVELKWDGSANAKRFIFLSIELQKSVLASVSITGKLLNIAGKIQRYNIRCTVGLLCG